MDDIPIPPKEGFLRSFVDGSWGYCKIESPMEKYTDQINVWNCKNESWDVFILTKKDPWKIISGKNNLRKEIIKKNDYMEELNDLYLNVSRHPFPIDIAENIIFDDTLPNENTVIKIEID